VIAPAPAFVKVVTLEIPADNNVVKGDNNDEKGDNNKLNGFTIDILTLDIFFFQFKTMSYSLVLRPTTLLDGKKLSIFYYKDGTDAID
jgi:hypothetical protein